ncbi:MAG TPA: glycosyltransferase, partial [Pyrinomonadaceae bacterium]
MNNASSRDEMRAAAAVGVASDAPFVSVVIPCFNEERYIVKVLERVCGQYAPTRSEIIVVDGRS